MRREYPPHFRARFGNPWRQNSDIRLLTSPRIFLVGMAAFLVLVGFVALILYKQIAIAFNANPGPQRADPRRSGDRLAVRLPPGDPAVPRNPLGQFADQRPDGEPPDAARACSAPMATLLNAGAGARGLSTITTRAILDSIGTRLDEGRELNRYLVGLLVFLGLLGTFWGLLETVHSISGVIDSMKTGADTTTMFDDLKSGLSAPIAGMSVSFTSSLFGLAGSLILGFLDLQAGQAQNRFYTELEDFLAEPCRDDAAVVDVLPEAPSRHEPAIETSATAQRRSPLSPKASRRWSPTCARSSSKSATGSTRRPRSRRTSASCCAACSTNSATVDFPRTGEKLRIGAWAAAAKRKPPRPGP